MDNDILSTDSQSQEENNNESSRKQLLMQMYEKASELASVKEIDNETVDKIRTSADITNEIMKSDSVHFGATTTAELLLDAHVLKMNCEQLSKAFVKKSQFNEDVYANAIFEMGWEDITKEACAIGRTLYGTPIAYIEKVDETLTAKGKLQRKKRNIDKITQPETIQKIKRIDKGANALKVFQTEVVNLFKSNGNTPIPYYKLIISPGNLLKSAHNALILSFLVRDEIIFMNKQNANHPLVSLITAEQREKAEIQQFVVTLSYDLIDEMVEYYNITEPLLKVEYEYSDDEETDDDE